LIPISATIITLNEEERIARTIAALDFCDEIVVVDARSTDRTVERAAGPRVRVLSRDWTGYADQKNYAARSATHDWILNVDADERPGPELRAEILAWKREGLSGGVTACSMPRLTEYLGGWIRHSGWYPDRKVRLYDRRGARWQGDLVHETVVTEGRVRAFRGDLLHFPFRSLEDHHQRIDRYTVLAARAAEKAGRRFSRTRVLLGPPAFFLRSFLLRTGFLDGWRGLRIAYMGARYVYLREVRISR
jgi:glycosyltransferase involved in cell wall biosynthesis